MAGRVATFDDWRGLFDDWQKDLGLDAAELSKIGLPPMETKYDPLDQPEIPFGDYAGRPRWERVLQIPDQRVRDALLTLIVYQGDTEFASVEQQRLLIDSAPSEYDAYSLVRVMGEEMRHGWQMAHILVTHFGADGRREAEKLLARCATRGDRLLGSFNQPVDNWVDFFTYTAFIDRDGKYQLMMLGHSAFAPLAQSIPPMLREEAFHLGTGVTGLKRIVQAGVIPVEVLQKYINKWVSTAYDLFGTDHSSSAHWNYVWGLKGRPDEDKSQAPADRDALNEHARGMYAREVDKIVRDLNTWIPSDRPRLRIPDLRFNRSIGDDAHKPYSVEGEPMAAEAFEKYREQVLPRDEDRATVAALTAQPAWIKPRN